MPAMASAAAGGGGDDAAAAVSFAGVSYDVPVQLSRAARLAAWVRGAASRGGGGGGGGGGDGGGGVEGRAAGDEEKGRGGPEATRILRGVSGCVFRGESLAVLGPSGAGKSSLLNLLAGRAQYPVVGGQMLFDGKVRDSRTKRGIGYCTQDDIFFTRLTVRETLEFTAAIRMQGRMDWAERQERVDEIVAKLRLGKCLDTRIGDQQFDKGISGGERKRVNIANELLAQDRGAIQLLDESTSGLDSTASLTVVRLLRALADEGHAIIGTIHQPTSQMLELFDTVLLLTEGEVAYFGPTRAMVRYFADAGFETPRNYNPADYVMQLVMDGEVSVPPSPSSSQQQLPPRADDASDASASASTADREVARDYLVRRWRERGPAFLAVEHPRALAAMGGAAGMAGGGGGGVPAAAGAGARAGASAGAALRGPARAVAKRARKITGAPDPRGLPEKYATSWTTQVRVLGLRALRQKRGALVDRVQLSQLASIVAICTLFWFRMDANEESLDDRLGALFFFNVFFAFFSTFSSLFAFPAEKAVLNKDRASGAYRLSAYYFAKTCVEVPSDMIYPTVFAVVVYYAIALNPSVDRFFVFIIILIAITLTAQSMGLALSAAMMNIRQAQVVSSVIILSSMLIGGFYVDRDNLPSFLRPFRFLSYVKYGYSAFVRNEVRGREFPCVAAGDAVTVYSGNGAFCPITGEDVLRGAQLDDSLSILGNIGVLCVWVITFRFLGYFALKYLHRPHKERVA